MPLVRTARVDLACLDDGDPAATAVVLVMGLGTQLIRWPPALVERLLAAGYRVIRFDNRDVGLSTHCDDAPLPNLGAFLRNGTSLVLPYTLADLADDTAALLDALGIDAAHVAGASMGGMIAQLVTIRHRSRVRSLTSIMSSTSNPALPGPTPAARQTLFAPLPRSRDEAALLADALARQRVLASPAFPTGDLVMHAQLERELRRSFYPPGVVRQLAALLAAPDRRSQLRQLEVPAVVLHGRADPLIPVACGIDTAANLAGAELRIVEGMGHDFPDALAATFADAIIAAARRADESPAETANG
jgi:pimeloyl-ACP methyl ester carboxylesterase